MKDQEGVPSPKDILLLEEKLNSYRGAGGKIGSDGERIGSLQD